MAVEIEDSPMIVGAVAVVVVVVKVVGDGDAVIITGVPCNTAVGCRTLDKETTSGAGHNRLGQGTQEGSIWLTSSGGVTINT